MAKRTKRTSKSSTTKRKKKSPSTSSARAEAQFLAKLWGDDEFRAAFVADPISVLQQSGFSIPEGVQIKVVQDTPDTYHIVIPNRPQSVSVKSISVEKRPAMILTRRPEFSSGTSILTRRPRSESESILTRRPSRTTKSRRRK